MNLSQFQNWALAQGSVGKYTDGQFVGECVSLINQYLGRVYGISAGAWGNAKDWATNGSVLGYFDRVGDLQPGDIVVYGPNFGGGYGHIGIYLGNNKILDQNGADDGKIRVNNLYPGYTAILRRKGSTPEGGDMPASKDKVDETAVKLEYNASLLRDASAEEVAIRVNSGQTMEALQRDLIGSDEHRTIQRLVKLGYETETGQNLPGVDKEKVLAYINQNLK